MQVHASVHGLKLITFDADGTLYADGAHMMHDNEMIRHIYTLLQKDEVNFSLPSPNCSDIGKIHHQGVFHVSLAAKDRLR
jgi:hypothetical protein